MKTHPLYENLDTAFVNLSALIKYLRLRQFVGLIRFASNSYEAEINLLESNKIAVREHDKISGRKAEGEDVFHRLMIRSREPGGTIHVYQVIETAKTQMSPVRQTPVKNGNGHHSPEFSAISNTNGTAVKAVKAAPVAKNELPHHPKFPFKLSNQVENKARQTNLSEQEWNNLLALTAELLGTIDRTLAEAKLDFDLAFSKARTEISADYPFLHPQDGIFAYKAGKIMMTEQVSAKLFIASIIESLRRILEKLGRNPKFSEVYRLTTQKILALIKQRQTFYDNFSFSPPLKKIIGV